MPITCPKCRHIRQSHENAPDWQCPACGVAYVKAGAGESGKAVVRVEHSTSALSWGKVVVLLIVALGVWQGLRVGTSHGVASIGARITGSVSAEELTKLATTVKQGDVVIYTTTSCPYCAQAKSWMSEYGFAFTECNTETSNVCANEFDSFKSDGVPYLVVRGHHMKDGFDSDEFVAALRT
jgi:glutaredoxin